MSAASFAMSRVGCARRASYHPQHRETARVDDRRTTKRVQRCGTLPRCARDRRQVDSAGNEGDSRRIDGQGQQARCARPRTRQDLSCACRHNSDIDHTPYKTRRPSALYDRPRIENGMVLSERCKSKLILLLRSRHREGARGPEASEGAVR